MVDDGGDGGDCGDLLAGICIIHCISSFPDKDKRIDIPTNIHRPFTFIIDKTLNLSL